ncbi:MAG: hypothetical protein HZC17_06500 [Candidatus Omnitrophica bacterium]|nr:hypothetical protein [Candidatus Omnitrophota bacterium]
MKKLAAIFALLSLIAFVPGAYADWNDEADNGDYYHKVPAMAGRGFVNAVTCPGYFIESTFFSKNCEGKKACDAVGTEVNNIVTGFGKSVAAGVGGVWDVATSVLPEYRGAGYQRGMWPNYKWEKESSSAPAEATASAPAAS